MAGFTYMYTYIGEEYAKEMNWTMLLQLIYHNASRFVRVYD